MSKKRIRAQLRKANNNHPNGKHDDIFDSYILPATAEAYERMVEQAAEELYDEHTIVGSLGGGAWKQIKWSDCEHDRRIKKWWLSLGATALRAIGITAPKKGRT